MTTFSFTAANRFLKYVTIDTQSDPNSTSYPSTEKQKDLGKVLVEELLAMGISDAHMDEFGYVYATIPSNSSKQKIPVLCFCAHMDTAPDASGTDVKPIVHKNYTGSDIVLPDDPTQIVSPNRYPFLHKKIGEDLITASGLTLLGSDDKAGVAEIMDAAFQLMNTPDIKHGKIRLLFTPDEEVGRGVDKIDMKKLGADYGYTLDGGNPGTLEDETFSADGVVIEIKGVPIHPGYAKDKMENAIKIAGIS
jgi:tripeptide aminopeptidase